MKAIKSYAAKAPPKSNKFTVLVTLDRQKLKESASKDDIYISTADKLKQTINAHLWLCQLAKEFLFCSFVEDVIRHEFVELDTGSHEKALRASRDYFDNNLLEFQVFKKARRALSRRILSGQTLNLYFSLGDETKIQAFGQTAWVCPFLNVNSQTQALLDMLFDSSLAKGSYAVVGLLEGPVAIIKAELLDPEEINKPDIRQAFKSLIDRLLSMDDISASITGGLSRASLIEELRQES
ncbi:MAG: hypothetical protein JRI96_16400 [Deltaproteobacteria bacterium]|nr:hypothetical protein [Deltaproteobacteria bacterium]